MAQLYNPWQSPPSTGTLSGDLATFEINDTSESVETLTESEDDAMEDANEQSSMQQALQVIDQQAQIIKQLLSSLKL